MTVGVPFKGDTGSLRKCVRSLLQQTHTDLRVLVIADGRHPGLISRDSRVHIHTLPKNQGTYFARAVALAATETEHHAVVDADDWVDADWLETLLATNADAALHSCYWSVTPGRTFVYHPPKLNYELSGNLINRMPHVGVYRTQTLIDAGGYNPAFRVGYDTLLVSILLLRNAVRTVDTPQYHRCVRANSLTRDKNTGLGSPYRRQVRETLADTWAKIWNSRHDPAQAAQIARALAPAELWEQVAEEAERIR